MNPGCLNNVLEINLPLAVKYSIVIVQLQRSQKTESGYCVIYFI